MLPTLRASLRLLPAGFETDIHASTDSEVLVAVEGHGTSTIGDARFNWQPNDIFVAPSWLRRRHRAASEAVLVSFSDCAAQQSPGIRREQRSVDLRHGAATGRGADKSLDK